MNWCQKNQFKYGYIDILNTYFYRLFVGTNGGNEKHYIHKSLSTGKVFSTMITVICTYWNWLDSHVSHNYVNMHKTNQTPGKEDIVWPKIVDALLTLTFDSAVYVSCCAQAVYSIVKTGFYQYLIRTSMAIFISYKLSFRCGSDASIKFNLSIKAVKTAIKLIQHTKSPVLDILYDQKLLILHWHSLLVSLSMCLVVRNLYIQLLRLAFIDIR